MSERTYSTNEAARMLGCTYRQLDHWSRRGLLPDQDPGAVLGCGGRRRLTDADLTRAHTLMMVSLLRSGALEDTIRLLEQIGMRHVIEARTLAPIQRLPELSTRAELPPPVSAR